MDIRIGAYGLIVRDRAILLTHWNEDGRSGWTLPGGGVEDFETVPDAAVREIREETGYSARLGDLIGVHSLFIAAGDRINGIGRPLHALRIVYLAEVVGGTLSQEIAGSSDEAKWFGLDTIDRLDRLDLVDIGLAMWGDSPTAPQPPGSPPRALRAW
ncbi:MAG: NUDIX hydrolase [Rhodoglobus sp.]